MRKLVLFLVMISFLVCASFAQTVKVDLAKVQETFVAFNVPFTVSIEKEVVVFTPTQQLDPLKRAYNLQNLYQAWNFYLTSNKIELTSLGIKILDVKTLGKATIEDLSAYNLKKLSSNKPIPIGDYFK